MKIVHQPNRRDVLEFIIESNHIENERSEMAHEDALFAWELLNDEMTLTVENVLATNGHLMKRLNPRIAGRFRNMDVYIGGRKGVNPILIREKLDAWLEAMNMEMVAKTKEDIAALTRRARGLHVEYEQIHPFEDGNGRTGRIFYNWYLIRVGLPLHIIHEGAEQMDYYKWFDSKRYH